MKEDNTKNLKVRFCVVCECYFPEVFKTLTNVFFADLFIFLFDFLTWRKKPSFFSERNMYENKQEQKRQCFEKEKIEKKGKWKRFPILCFRSPFCMHKVRNVIANCFFLISYIFSVNLVSREWFLVYGFEPFSSTSVWTQWQMYSILFFEENARRAQKPELPLKKWNISEQRTTRNMKSDEAKRFWHGTLWILRVHIDLALCGQREKKTAYLKQKKHNATALSEISRLFLFCSLFRFCL